MLRTDTISLYSLDESGNKVLVAEGIEHGLITIGLAAAKLATSFDRATMATEAFLSLQFPAKDLRILLRYARLDALRHQLKRKGRPGWRSICIPR